MSKRHSRLFIREIIESSEAILQYVRGVSFDEFVNDRMRYSAVIREFEIIEEAVSKLPDTLKAGYPWSLGRISRILEIC